MAMALGYLETILVGSAGSWLTMMGYKRLVARAMRQPVAPDDSGWTVLTLAPASRVILWLTIPLGLVFIVGPLAWPDGTSTYWPLLLFGLALVALGVISVWRAYLCFNDEEIDYRAWGRRRRVRWDEVDKIAPGFFGTSLVIGQAYHLISNQWVGWSSFVAQARRCGVEVADSAMDPGR